MVIPDGSLDKDFLNDMKQLKELITVGRSLDKRKPAPATARPRPEPV